MKKMQGKKVLTWLLIFAMLVSMVATNGAVYAQAAKKVKLNVTKTKTLQVGKSYKLKVKNLPQKAKKVKYKWTSSKKKVASVSKKGKVKAKKVGTTKITCKVTYKIEKSNKTVAQKKKLKCKIKVVAASTGTPTPKPTATEKPGSTPTGNPEPSTPPSKPTPTPTPIPDDEETFPYDPSVPDVDTVDGDLVTLTQKNIVKEMGAGWNLGNQLEASSNGIPNETAWSNPIITEDLIKLVKSAGFSSIRVPVSYLNYISTTANEDGSYSYKIDPSWLKRIKEVVDMCMEEKLYTIINMHGDGYTTVQNAWLFCGFAGSGNPYTGGQLPNGDYYRLASEFNTTVQIIIMNGDDGALATTYTYDSKEYTKTNEINSDGSFIFKTADGKNSISVFYFSEICNKYKQCWEQIATCFKDYDGHLIFESMNEEFDGTYTAPKKAAYQNINTYNQVFVDAVRKTGGNNDKRWLLIPGWNTNIDQIVGNYGFELPTDEYLSSEIPEGQKRIMISVHYYDPWDFCGNPSSNVTQWGESATDSSKVASYGNPAFLDGQFKKMNNKFVSEGYPVVIGEYGSIDKTGKDPNNAACREEFATKVCEAAIKYGCVPVYWDNNGNNNTGEDFGLFDRRALTVTQQGIIDAILAPYGGRQSMVTGIALDETQLTMKVGDITQLTATLTPSYANDIITWKSSKTSVAEVSSSGRVKAKGKGTCTITAEANGYTATCDVTVEALDHIRARLYCYSVTDWTIHSDENFVEIDSAGGDNYTLSITLPKEQMTNIASFFIKDLMIEEGGASTSLFKDFKLTIKSATFNGEPLTFTKTEFTPTTAGKFDFNFINLWDENENYIQETKHTTDTITSSEQNGYMFTGTYQDMNTVTINFAISGIVTE